MAANLPSKKYKAALSEQSGLNVVEFKNLSDAEGSGLVSRIHKEFETKLD
jgi:hypothetical protein